MPAGSKPSAPGDGDALDAVMRPRSIAVVGASRSSGTIGHQIVANLVRYGFTGPVYPVNPRATSVHSIRCYPSIEALPEAVDLTVVAVPKEGVIQVAEDCGLKGVRSMVVISAGFREAGPQGVVRETALVDVVRRYRMRLVGPNCLGVLNADPATSMNATFAPTMPRFGPVAFVSQSGAVGLNLLDYATELEIGICQFVSIGNRADVSSNDLLLHWEADPAVGVILMYVEHFGNPRRFLEIASRISRKKPIVVVKSGRSTVGAGAASSHTGALAASDTAVSAMLRQAGVIRAETVEELFNLAVVFSTRRRPGSRRTAVLTNSGGPGIMAADAIDVCGLAMPDLDPATVSRLRPLFPPEASLRNPLDTLATAPPARYRAALDALLEDPRIDSVIAIFVPPLGVPQTEIATAIAAVPSAETSKPVIAVLMGREGLPHGRAELHAAGIPTYIFPESAVQALAALCRHGEWQRRPLDTAPDLSVNRAEAGRVLDRARTRHRRQLTATAALELAHAYGIAVAAGGLAHDRDEAARIAETIGYPVVLKVESADLVHKTDFGGVRVGVQNAEAVRTAFDQLSTNAERAQPGVALDGVLVQQMVRAGRELIVGFTRDPAFGPLVMFGLGGILTEATRDVVFGLAPIRPSDATEMVQGIRSYRMLGAFRGAPAVDRGELEAVLVRISQLALDFPEIREFEMNPILAGPERTVAVDARATLLLPTRLQSLEG